MGESDTNVARKNMAKERLKNLQPGHGDGFQTQLQLLATQIALSLTHSLKI